MMSVEQDIAALQSASTLSFASKSISSNALRQYTESRIQNRTRFQYMLTDLRDKKEIIEAEAGKIFQVKA